MKNLRFSNKKKLENGKLWNLEFGILENENPGKNGKIENYVI